MTPPLLPEQPTGQQLVDVVHDLARIGNIRPVDVARNLSKNPWSWLRHVANAKRPTPEMVERVRRLLEHHPATVKLEPAPPSIPDAAPRPTERPAAPARVDVCGNIDPPMSRAVAAGSDPRRIASSREACPRCAIRGDIGCAHQRPYGEADHQFSRSVVGTSSIPATAETVSVVNPDVPRKATPEAAGAVSDQFAITSAESTTT